MNPKDRERERENFFVFVRWLMGEAARERQREVLVRVVHVLESKSARTHARLERVEGAC